MIGSLVCFFKEHEWSEWMHWITGDKDYRFCYRCGNEEFRV